MTLVDEKHFLDGILRDDPATLLEIYRQCYPVVRGIILRYGGMEQDAQDMFQEAILLIYQRLKSGKLTLTSRFGSLLNGVAYNLFRSYQQKKDVSGTVTFPADDKYALENDLEMEFEKIELQRLFDQAMEQLGEDCRQVLLLFFQDKSMEEIAEIMKYGSTDYARRKKYLCKEKLLEIIKGYPELRDYLMD